MITIMTNQRKIIDLKGHCFFCFEKAENSYIPIKSDTLSDIFSYVQPKWNYNNLSEFTFVSGGEENSDVVPPMCNVCRGEMEKIAIFHGEIIQLKKRLEELHNQVDRESLCVRERMRHYLFGSGSKSKALKQLLSDNGVSSISMEYLMELLKNLNEPGTFSTVDYLSNESTKQLTKNLPKRKGRRKIKEDDVSTLERSSSPKEIVKLEPEDIEIKCELNSEEEDPLHFAFPDEETDEEANKSITKINGLRTLRNRRSKSDASTKLSKTKEKDDKQRYQSCEVCGEAILLLEMYNHMHQHTGDYAVKCPNPKCNLMFLGRWSNKFRIHMSRSKVCSIASKSSEKSQAKVCDTCGEQFENLLLFGLHLQRHENFEKNFSCPISNCKESFTVKQSVEYHLRSHGFARIKDSLLQRCSLCQEKLTPQGMEQHLQMKHGQETSEILKCSHCPFVFMKRDELVEHLTIKTHLKEGITCDLCQDDTIYHNGFRLRDHYFTTHGIGSKFVCAWGSCDYSTYSEYVLRLHTMKVHEGKVTLHKCEVCDPPIQYATEIALKSHNIKFHGADPYKCRFCSSTFTAKGYLDEHEKAHLGVLQQPQPYQCNQCGRVLSSKKIYKEHVRLVHHSERNFKCDSCDKIFKREKSLRLHEKMEHLGVRHVCDTCGRSFKRPELFKQHQRIHTGERPFTCELCGKSFRQRCTWKTHMKSHETKGEKFVPKGTIEKVGC